MLTGLFRRPAIGVCAPCIAHPGSETGPAPKRAGHSPRVREGRGTYSTPATTPPCG